MIGGDELSRADLARRTGLTPATVSALVAELAEVGLITEVGTRRVGSQVGKPPKMLRTRPEARNLVAIDLSDPAGMRAGVVDFSGEIVSSVGAISSGGRNEAAVAEVESLIAEALALATAPILGIGIGTPGVVSPDGVVVESTTFGWHHLALSAWLEQRFGYPVHVANDANVAAIAEYTRGDSGVSNLAVIKIGTGVGAGLIVNGRPLSGEHAGAGELGHLVVKTDGPLCRCGNKGCLEAFIASPHIRSLLEVDGADLTEVRERAAMRLGVALASVVAILDIQHIFLSGPRVLLGEDFCAIATESLRARCLRSTGDSVEVAFSTLGDDVVLLGAAGLVLSQELGVA